MRNRARFQARHAVVWREKKLFRLFSKELIGKRDELGNVANVKMGNQPIPLANSPLPQFRYSTIPQFPQFHIQQAHIQKSHLRPGDLRVDDVERWEEYTEVAGVACD